MTLYLIKHGSSDYRLHREDGAELSTWSTDPRTMADGPIPEFVEGIASAYNGASILGDATARRVHAQAVAGEWNYRDLTISDETVPWQ